MSEKIIVKDTGIFIQESRVIETSQAELQNIRRVKQEFLANLVSQINTFQAKKVETEAEIAAVDVQLAKFDGKVLPVTDLRTDTAVPVSEVLLAPETLIN
jgi:hypothetical protein